jgi:hypothetical protein
MDAEFDTDRGAVTRAVHTIAGMPPVLDEREQLDNLVVIDNIVKADLANPSTCMHEATMHLGVRTWSFIRCLVHSDPARLHRISRAVAIASLDPRDPVADAGHLGLCSLTHEPDN